MAIRELLKYETVDGMLHDTESAATIHYVTLLENEFGKLIDQLTIGMGSIGPSDRLKMLKNAMGDRANAINIMASIINTVEFE